MIKQIDGYTVLHLSSNGEEGLRYLRQHAEQIDVVMTDIDMPKIDGLSLIRQAKEEAIGVPFIVFSAREDAYAVFTALELGAIEFIKKPKHIFQKDIRHYTEKVEKALQMAVEAGERSNMRNISGKCVEDTESMKDSGSRQLVRKTGSRAPEKENKSRKLVAIVCSTGGPRALQSVIPKLPANLAAPVVLVQHMPEGFTNTLAVRLDEQSKVHVKEAAPGDLLEDGCVYIAKGGTHLALRKTKQGCEVYYEDIAPIGGLKPCGNIMLKSLCESPYDEIICVILTGMGADGTKGIQELSKKKEVYVIAQDEASSTVYGMPRAVYEAGLCDCISSLSCIADEIIKKAGVR